MHHVNACTVLGWGHGLQYYCACALPHRICFRQPCRELCFYTSPVPRPHPQGGRALELDDMAFLNCIAPIRFTPSGLYVIIRWHCTITVYTACVWEWLTRCHAKTMCCHAIHMIYWYCILCAHEITRYTYMYIPDPFPSLRVEPGNVTFYTCAQTCPFLWCL